MLRLSSAFSAQEITQKDHPRCHEEDRCYVATGRLSNLLKFSAIIKRNSTPEYSCSLLEIISPVQYRCLFNGRHHL